jgi:hypothetical protein
MADYLKVQEHPDLARDTVSGAIVNTNMQAYEAAVNRSRNVKQQKDSMRT